MRAHEFLELLGGVRESGGGQWSAVCPAHDDDSPSLSVAEGHGRILVNCFAGCGVGAIITALGLEWHDLFFDEPTDERHPYYHGEMPPEPPPGYVFVGFQAPPEWAPGRSVKTSSAPKPPDLPTAEQLTRWMRRVQIVGPRLRARKGWTQPTLIRMRLGWDGQRVTIPVYDAAGELASLLRYLPGAAAYKMLAPKGAARHLYPAPEQFQTPDLWLVEGEPDAISARELGLPAVGVPGVSTWREDWTERFLGRKVTICFDCDEQGRAAAATRLEDFRTLGIQARAIDLAPHRHNGYDIGDALSDAMRLGRLDRLHDYILRLSHEAWR